jgi:hypothetical protein
MLLHTVDSEATAPSLPLDGDRSIKGDAETASSALDSARRSRSESFIVCLYCLSI